MSKTNRTLLALAVTAIVLVIAAWFDTTGFFAILEQYPGDNSAAGAGVAVGSLLIAGSGMLLGVLAWGSASAVVGLAYVAVGGLFVVLPWLYWTFGVPTNGLSPGGPEPLASIILNIQGSTFGGLHAVTTIGAAMLIAGVATLVRWWRGRADAPSHAQDVVPTAEPTRP